MAAFRNTVVDRDELRTIYRQPSPGVQRKKIDHVDAGARAFIAAAPFCLVATSSSEGRCDVSPRGGPAGFVRVLDEKRLAIPDLSGNNLLDSLENMLGNPHIGLLFVLPGRDETLRLEGRASLTTDPEVLSLWDGELRRPRLAVGVEVGEVYIHCAKSFRRAEVWDATTWDRYTSAPDVCELVIDAMKLDVTVDAVRADLEKAYLRDLTDERDI